ncbi:hypothetical protein D3C71_2002800 [compost metagenome]
MKQHVGEGQLLRPVENEAHGAIVRMGADEDDRASEIGVKHPGHGDQELTVKKASLASLLRHRSSHHANSLSIRREMKSASASRPIIIARTAFTSPCPIKQL